MRGRRGLTPGRFGVAYAAKARTHGRTRKARHMSDPEIDQPPLGAPETPYTDDPTAAPTENPDITSDADGTPKENPSG
jgi:hypothetical protein